MPEINLTASKEDLVTNFNSLLSAKDVAYILEIKPSLLNYHLFINPPQSSYTVFTISKKGGGKRKISTPITALKIIQQKLCHILYQVYKPKPSVHGFVLGKSIVTNAEVHSKKRYVFNIDLKDFYPSINFGRVRGMFMAYPYKLNSSVATVLAQICVFENELPQGAPTSPIVSNMICAKMDSELQLLAKEQRCTYTRYADDITFSTSKKRFPIELASINSLMKPEVGEPLNQIIQQNGFEINCRKIRLHNSYQRQVVTGLITNKFPNVNRKFKNQIRAMLYAWKEFGLELAQQEFETKHYKKHRNPKFPASQFRLVVKGKIEFLGMVRGKLNPEYIRFRAKLKKLDPSLVNEPDNPLDDVRLNYNKLLQMKDHQKRGFELEKLLNRLFKIFRLSVLDSFKRNEGAEQIDGAFSLEGWYYLIECKWTEKISDPSQVDVFQSKLGRSGKQSLGIFISIKGWSRNVPKVLKKNPEKNIILLNGKDLVCVLEGKIKLKDLIRIKGANLNLKSEPYYSAKKCIKDLERGELL